MSTNENGTGEDLLKIGDFARLAGTNLRTLRYYEELGLLRPPKRSPGGFRYFRRADLNRINAIRGLQELGLSLERIKDLLDMCGERGDRLKFMAGVRKALEEETRLLRENMARLEEQSGKVQTALKKLEDCQPCTHMPEAANNFCEPCQHTGRPLPEFLSALF